MLDGQTFEGTVYTWSMIGSVKFEIGFLIDPLTALMMVVAFMLGRGGNFACLAK